MRTPRPSAITIWHWFINEGIGTFFLTLLVICVYTASDHGFPGFSSLYVPVVPALVYFTLATLNGSVLETHYNPILTITLALYRRLSPYRAVWYVVAQIIGAFSAVKVAEVIVSPTPPLMLVTPTTAGVIGEFVGAIFFVWIFAMATKRSTSALLGNAIVSLGLFIGLTLSYTGGGGWLNPAISIGLGTKPLATSLLYVVIPLLGAIAGYALSLSLHESKKLVAEEEHGN